MGTRAFVVNVNPKNQKAEVMYVHREGYPEWMCPILGSGVTTTSQLRRLMKTGGLTNLGKSPLVTISFDENDMYDENDFASVELRGGGEKLDRIPVQDFEEYLAGSMAAYVYVAVPYGKDAVAWYSCPNDLPYRAQCAGVVQSLASPKQ